MTSPGLVPIDWQNGPSRSPRSEFDVFDGPQDSPIDRLHQVYATDPTDPEAEVDTDEAAPSIHQEN
jgi:hypothetical protein